MSDITAFQYLRRRDDEYEELRDRELEDWLVNRLQLRVPSLVTSSTRPTTNLFRGMRIFETDTGNELVYYGATTGWQKPWNQPWGEVGLWTATTAQTGIGFPYTDVTSLTSGSITYIAGRKLVIEAKLVARQRTTAAAAFIGINLGGALLDETLESLGVNDWWSAGLAARHNTAGGAATIKVQAQTGGGTLDIDSTATRIATLRITDDGPSSSAPAS